MSGQPPEAKEHASRWPGWIWSVPIAAAAIVGYLAVQQIALRGPEVTVTFPTGGGLQAGNTKVKLEGITVGSVETVHFRPDMHHVDAVLRLHGDMADHLGPGTTFWLEGQNPSLGNLASLKAVIAGPSIGVQPRPGHHLKHYVGLASKPPTAGDVRGTEFVLRGDRLGTIAANSPVFYRDLRVGEVQQTALEADNRHFRITVFIDAPFDRLVHDGTRFWNASAVQVSTSPNGPRLQFQSVPALFQGAVDFTTPDQAGAPAKADAVFRLYASRDAAQHAPDARAVTYRVTFQAGEAGDLPDGAAVTLADRRVGTVTGSTLQYDPATGMLRTVVTLAIEPSDIALAGAQWAPDARTQMNAMLSRLIAEGLRARLGSAIPVVGGKTVELAFVPAPTPASLGSGAVPSIPAGPPSSVSGIIASVNAVAAKLNAMPIDQIAADVHQATQHIAALSASPRLQATLRNLDESMANVAQVTRQARTQAGPILAELRGVARQAQSAVAGVRSLVSGNALRGTPPGTADVGDTLYELSRAARSLRQLADYLDRHPEALLRGRGSAG
ncbi:MAG TPA: MlaD family protein [Acetobacteraceae bacterium]|nr:MlaD family protein [Acetobacteraceae bacterium]